MDGYGIYIKYVRISIDEGMYVLIDGAEIVYENMTRPFMYNELIIFKS